MRGGVAGLASPHPLGLAMPAIYLEDDFTQRFLAALDEVLAPVLLPLDCLDSHFDPALAPEDFLDWLAGWVAVPVDEGWPLRLRRELVRQAVELHRWRGTARGIAAEVRLLTGGDVEVTDSGDAVVPAEPGAAPPIPAAPAAVRVRVRVADPAAVDRRRLREVVAASVPAHVYATVDVEES